MPKILLCFPEGKHKALTMSYDDGMTADRKLVSIFNRYGIKGSFHLNAGMFGTGNRLTEEEAAALYEGHEVSAHTLTHPTIARCPKEQIVHEVMEDRKGLEHLVGYSVRGNLTRTDHLTKKLNGCFPLWESNYAPVVQTTGDFSMPDDWPEWKPTCHHNDRLLSARRHSSVFNKRNTCISCTMGS